MLTGRVRWPGYVGVSLTYWNLGEICGALSDTTCRVQPLEKRGT